MTFPREHEAPADVLYTIPAKEVSDSTVAVLMGLGKHSRF